MLISNLPDRVFSRTYNTSFKNNIAMMMAKGSEFISDDASVTELKFNRSTGQNILSIGANPSTFTWPDGHKASAERLTDVLPSYRAALQYSKQNHATNRLEPTRENVIRSLDQQGVCIKSFAQVNLFSQRTVNNQILKAIVESASDDELEQTTSITANMLQVYLMDGVGSFFNPDLIFLGWGAALGDNILTKPRFEKYREKLYELLEPHFDKLMCMKLSETMQPYHPSSSAYRVVPLSTLIRRDQFAEMFHLN